ncbi:MAG: hypothetical protein ACODAF_06300 [Actinomycetota bacterium]
MQPDSTDTEHDTGNEVHRQDGQPTPTPWSNALGVAIGLAVLVGALVTAFAWPASETRPRDVPLAVVAPPGAVAEVEQRLSSAMPGAFDVEPAPDAGAARELIADREVYGAIILDPAGPPQALTASAASPAVAQMLEGVATQLAQQAGGAPAPQVEDVVPLPDQDPRGAGLTAAALPMTLGGLAIGLGMSFTVAGARRVVAGALVAATATGLIAALVVQVWLGSLDGNYWVNAGVIALAVAAVSVALIGLYAALGRPGIGLGALVMLLLGNPLSGVPTAPEMLPNGWGAFGQLLPPGASGTLLRSTAFFDGAAAGGPLLVLTAWLAGGLLLAVVGHRRLRLGSRALEHS